MIRAVIVIAIALPSSCANNGAKCSDNSDCSSGNCDANNKTCLRNDCDVGRPCTRGLTCRVDDEIGNTCQPALGRDEPCDQESDTPPGGFTQGCAASLACVQDPRETAGNARCLPPSNRTSGEFCSTSSECASSLDCDLGQCG